LDGLGLFLKKSQLCREEIASKAEIKLYKLVATGKNTQIERMK
jgi:hypothetical protein